MSAKDDALDGGERTDVPGAVGGSRALALLLVITGAAGLLASWVITIDKFELLKDPNFQPGCSINPIVACGSIMKSEQAEAFGFPNPMLGLVTYAIIIGVGMSLLAGARFPRWYWLTMNAGMLFGVEFCTWLMIQSLYEINALCLWCCLAWVATLLMFWYVTSFNVRKGFLPAPGWVKSFFEDFSWALPVMHIGVIAMLILTRWGADLWA
ncbi:vitamin K epoxide reductase family protein [Streptomyces sp. NBC_01381]|uniref:vitamin K epoxide reductase family protein n=1 Tax=Streptomyces sp. NBC_01381 TaxID=2903845 RepID=UPI00224EC663|nr:vitamin K epoxide reductase family protein [Streptomyces sp. NBC_01381]MCX4668624.1 vitamin K epoxide reductase family protein [Streptomyces sp. NBC_01381]